MNDLGSVLLNLIVPCYTPREMGPYAGVCAHAAEYLINLRRVPQFCGAVLKAAMDLVWSTSILLYGPATTSILQHATIQYPPARPCAHQCLLAWPRDHQWSYILNSKGCIIKNIDKTIIISWNLTGDLTGDLIGDPRANMRVSKTGWIAWIQRSNLAQNSARRKFMGWLFRILSNVVHTISRNHQSILLLKVASTVHKRISWIFLNLTLWGPVYVHDNLPLNAWVRFDFIRSVTGLADWSQ